MNGTRLALRGQQPVTLAALVAAGPEGTTKSRLYEDLFGDDPQESGEQAVVMRVQRLRNKLEEFAGDIPIITSGSRLGIDPDTCSVDVWEFDEVVRNFSSGWLDMLGRWEEPYRGLRSLPDSVLVSTERLRNTYRAGLAKVGWSIVDGGSEDLLERVAAEIELDPFNERLATSLAVGLYRSGNQPDALEVLSQFRARLLDDHGLNPGSDLDRAEHAILHNSLDPIASIEPLAEPAQTTQRVSPRLVAPSRFLGRGDLVAGLNQRVDALTSSSAGQGSIHVIVGPGGSGKSTLMAKVLAPLDSDDVAVFVGSAEADGGASDSASLYQPFVEAFPDLEAHLTARDSADGLSDDQAFWHEVHRTLQDAATSRPTVLVLENMHEADSASVALMRFLVGASQHPRLMIFVTTREPLTATPWDSTFETLADHPERVTVHALEPLTFEDIQALVRMDHESQPHGVRERFARWLADVSGGNALVATALSRNAPEDLSLGLLPGKQDPENAYFRHVNDLIPDRTLEQILWVAAMIGLEFESTLIEEVLDLDQETVEAQLERFTRLRLGHRRGLRRWRFDHLLTLNAVASSAGLMRPLLLARLARAGTDNPLRMLRYVHGAGDELDTEFRIEQLSWVAERLEEQGAHDETAHAWSLLGEIVPQDSPARLESLIGAAGALSRVGRRDLAADKREAAVTLARSLGNREAVFRAAVAGLPSGEYVDGESHRLSTLLDMTPDELREAPALEHAMWTLRFARLRDETAIAQSIVDSIDDSWDGAVEQRVSLHLERLCFEAQRHDAARVLREMQELCEICPDGPQRSDLLHRTALNVLIEQQPAEVARAAVVESAAHARTYGTARTKWSADVAASTLAAVGLIDSAASPSSARTSGHRWGIPDVEDNYFVQIFAELWLAGNVGLAQATIDAVRDDIALNVAWHAALALGAGVNGDVERARSEAAVVMNKLDAQPHGVWAPVAAALLAESSVVLDDPIAAERAIEALMPRSGMAILVGIGSAHLGPVDRYLGLAAGVLGDPNASSLLHQAVEQAEQGGITAWAQRAQQDLDQQERGERG